MPLKRNDRFRAGSGAFTCRGCGKTTRDTGNDEASLEACLTCLRKWYMENTESDYGKDSAEYKDAKADYEKQLAKDMRA